MTPIEIPESDGALKALVESVMKLVKCTASEAFKLIEIKKKYEKEKGEQKNEG